MGISQRPAAALVSPRLPQRLNHALAVTQHARVPVGALVRGIVVVAGRQSEGLDVAVGQADGEQWLAGVQGRREDVGVEGEGAGVFEHGDGGGLRAGRS